MPSNTGIWTPDEAKTCHAFDYYLARHIGQTFSRSVALIDIGCGNGDYLDYFHDIGFKHVIGYEGTPLGRRDVIEHDLTENLKVRYTGNVICLEVGEHIPEEHLDTFIDNVSKCVDYMCGLVISWAVPDQEGIGHVSCRDNEWVIEQFRRHGLTFIEPKTKELRENVSNHCAYFRETLMYFSR